jgi:hypothetical protein
MRRLALSMLTGLFLIAGCGTDGGGDTTGGAGGSGTGGSGSSSGGRGGSGTGGRGSGSGGSSATGGASAAGGSGGANAGSGGAGGSAGAGGTLGSGGAAGGAGSGGSGGSAGGAGTGGAAGGGGSASDAGTGGTTATTDGPAGEAPGSSGEGFMGLPPPPPGMTKIFNGVDLNDWECIAGAWEVKDGAMWGHYSGEDLCRTKQDYSYFRVVFNENGGGSNNHMGFGFWGDHGRRYGNALVVIPPSGAIWDYVAPERQVTGGVGSANNPIKHQWHQVEIIANRATGDVLTAVNGKQVSAIKDTRLSIRKHGPIGFQDHGGASNQYYRDIYIENEPKEFKLLTLKP